MTLATIKPGSTITRVYYSVPHHYTTGSEFESYLDALEAAIARRDELMEQVRAAYPATWKNLDRVVADAVRPSTVVDLRWVITYDGGSTDTVIERTNVFDVTTEELARRRRLTVAAGR